MQTIKYLAIMDEGREAAKMLSDRPICPNQYVND